MTEEEYEIFTEEFEQWLDERDPDPQDLFNSYVMYLEDKAKSVCIFEADDYVTPSNTYPLVADILMSEIRKSYLLSVGQRFPGVSPSLISDETLTTLCLFHAQQINCFDSAYKIYDMIRETYANAN